MHCWCWGVQPRRRWNANALLCRVVLTAQQLVEPSSILRLDKLLLLWLPLLVLRSVLTWVLHLVLELVLTLFWALLTLLLLPLPPLNLWAHLTSNLLILHLSLVLILVLGLSLLHGSHVAKLCHGIADVSREILEISADANVQQLFMECTTWFESCLDHFTQPAPHG